MKPLCLDCGYGISYGALRCKDCAKKHVNRDHKKPLAPADRHGWLPVKRRKSG